MTFHSQLPLTFTGLCQPDCTLGTCPAACPQFAVVAHGGRPTLDCSVRIGRTGRAGRCFGSIWRVHNADPNSFASLCYKMRQAAASSVFAFLRRKGGFKSWHHFYVSMFPPYTSLHCTSFKLPGQTPRAKVCQSTLHEFQGKVRRLPCSPSRTSSLCVVTGRHWGSLLPCRKKESIAWILLD